MIKEVLGFLLIKFMKNDRISVILNTYNSERFIDKTIQSVLNQTYTNFELLIVDDGSQDQTLKLISQIQDDRIQVYAYSNGGIATSRNRGLAHASGQYIAYLDHDELWTSEKLEHQWQCLQATPEASFVYSWVIMINEEGGLIRHLAPVQHTGNIYPKILGHNFVMTASNPLIRRTALIEIGGFDEAIYGADDWDLFIRLAKDHPVTLSPHYDFNTVWLPVQDQPKLPKWNGDVYRCSKKPLLILHPNLMPLRNDR
jgi:glycosyltransferase involved in cell wall biosynthesis